MKVGLLALMASFALVVGFPLAGMAGPPDTDMDTVPDTSDNCPTVANPLQTDTDGDTAGDACDKCSTDFETATQLACDVDTDGYGNYCDCDYDQDNFCGGTDFNAFQGNFGSAGVTITDQDCDSFTGGTDFNRFQAGFGGPPGPSGLGCAGSIPCNVP